MKATLGAGKNGRLRRKHRRDIAFHNPPLAFRKAQRRPERKSSEDKRTLPPQLRRDTCLMIASKMTFLPAP